MPTEEKKQTLSPGHPQRGFVSPDLSLVDGTTLSDEEQEAIADQQDEAEAVAEHEDRVAKAEAAEAEAEAKAAETPEAAPKAAAKAKAESRSSPPEGELLELPPGHDQYTGYVSPDLSFSDGVGALTQEEIDAEAARQAEWEADVAAVTAHEHEVASAARDDRLDHEKLKITSMDPTWVSISAPEIETLHVYGNGFTPATEIWWHDHLEPTVFVNEHEVTTGVTPWAFSNPDEILVGVRDGAETGGDLYFSLKP